MLTNLLIGKASASKLNKNKTKCVWIGAWNDRKDNHRFGIDFVEFIKKMVGFNIGNNVTQDDIDILFM
jgi:3-deoxy-D-arabino-heptulosonate 7-phosphate (DAHP) synthase class II